LLDHSETWFLFRFLLTKTKVINVAIAGPTVQTKSNSVLFLLYPIFQVIYTIIPNERKYEANSISLSVILSRIEARIIKKAKIETICIRKGSNTSLPLAAANKGSKNIPPKSMVL
jgi:hypothetical protein